MGMNSSERAKVLKESKTQSVSPKKFKNNQSMLPKRSRNSGEKLWNASKVLEDTRVELKKRRLEIELKKDHEISEKLSEEEIEKIVKLGEEIEEEVQEIATPIPMLLLKEKITQLRGGKTIKFAEQIEKQAKEMQELYKKLELSAKIKEEDLNKLKDIKKESAECCRELVSYMPNSNPRMLYTTVIGVSLAAGLVTSTVLEHTTRLSMLAIISMAAVSALVAGYVTYKTIEPNTKVDESRESHISSTSHSLPQSDG
ncbi:MAG: hypothetical protein ABOJ95_000700 [Wolbachia endosymbiont of Armadillidium vulgare]|nr:hypothetical protein [Wolbachia endosymbiont of Armadillidium vulgare]OJH31627.1 50S ribosomal protein L22P [Wolbachia endosymbiont of Armadillidium vulgare]OJH32036.1 50S ribosomal protein L22P [Wolbachia endosymbiont of Armadillidium vulgare]OJH32593.1 50S ribosomal protein L22P [Wolbachia endosymbiont of Armadillidium vulgare]OJH33215.1 50S ribosomal protein L22P [Wolbachia endosymbiont of Armadillidium vulgare]